MQRRTQLLFWYGGLAILAVLATRDLWKGPQVVEEIPYNDFQSALSDGRIPDVEVSGTALRGNYKEPNTEGVRSFVTQRVPMDVVRELEGHGVAFKGVTENTLLRAVLSWVVPALAFLALRMFLLKGVASKGAGGMLAIGKSKAKVYMETDTKVTFADVAGVDEALVVIRRYGTRSTMNIPSRSPRRLRPLLLDGSVQRHVRCSSSGSCVRTCNCRVRNAVNSRIVRGVPGQNL